MSESFSIEPSSYRDPSGFIFTRDGVVYRQVNKVYQQQFDHFINSGCYEHFLGKGWWLPQERLTENLTGNPEAYTTLRPEALPFISYPYEWSFSMLKDAALLTLQILREGIGYGMILKDATPFNIQWYKGRMVFIDALSMDLYDEKEPWVAYRQFCEQFLAPLVLMHYRKFPLQPLLLAYPEGIPLQLVKQLLPARTKYSLHTWLHIHLNAKLTGKPSQETKKTIFSKKKMLNLLTSLEMLVRKLELPATSSTWSAYYEEAGQRDNYLDSKKALVNEWLDDLKDVKRAADLGANDGAFSRMLSSKNIFCIAADMDPWCIERLYLSCKEKKEEYLHPLVMDLQHPSPAIGFDNSERKNFKDRCNADLVMALALVHHLAIGKNIPIERIAPYFATLTRKWLLVEFVPKEDPKVKLMLAGRKDIYDRYNYQYFESAFQEYFVMDKKQAIGNSGRTLYLFQKK